MKQLRVKTPFRDKNNFFLLHKVGDVVSVEDSRAALLVEGGLCEEIPQEKKEKVLPEPASQKTEAQEAADAPSHEPVAEPTSEPTKRTRKNSKR